MIEKSRVEIIEPAPVLNIPEFHLAFSSEIPRDSFGHPRHMEFVALLGQLFTVEEIHPRHHHSIYRISTPDYKAFDLYLDSRFTKPAGRTPSNTPSQEWKRNDLTIKMKSLLGTKYVWGGNWSPGISRMLHYYPPQKPLDEETLTLWTLKGVDCSGLLYEVSNGVSPRNTKGLTHFGSALPIEGKTPAEIAAELLPMDMAIWPGHVWFVLDQEHSIESKSPFGVIQRPLLERLEETCKERTGINGWPEPCDPNRYFTVRRFCSH